MKNLYTNAGIITFVAVASVLIVVLLLLSLQRHPLLPVEESRYPFAVFPSSDNSDGGSSRIVLDDYKTQLSYSYYLADGYEYPYASMTLGFGEKLVDWSRYNKIELTIACTPANILLFTAHTFDAEITNPSDYLSYRRARTTFSCGSELQPVTIDLTQLDAPPWWLLRYGLPLTQREYDLSKVFEVALENSRQSPQHTDTQVRITQALLIGHDWRFIAAAAVIALLLCLVLMKYYFIRHTRKLRAELSLKIEQESVVSSYQPVTATCKSDRERNAVLEFMATQYSNPELNLEFTTRSLGINRVKINDILREHQGLTFSAYLKKLRLTEAARLLREKEAGVAEIGFMVGFSNAPYFNQMFKKEFGCTPNVYKKTMAQNAASMPTER